VHHMYQRSITNRSNTAWQCLGLDDPIITGIFAETEGETEHNRKHDAM